MLSFEKVETVDIQKPCKIVGDFLKKPDHDMSIMRDCINENAAILNQLYDYIEELEQRIKELEPSKIPPR